MRYGRRNRYPGNGPFRDLPPYQRPGYLYGGRGRGFWGADPSKCARFPWLPRWWWTNPDYASASVPPIAPGYEDERKFLADQIKYLEQELSGTKKRLDELASQQETT
ncbi:MAG: DUF5320 domain-containing protein [Candidatus Bathyarchaeota archaeon]|nr:DUF5320 domain-containing protein [Candidatus Bathyarchaeota archaeon]